jgi:hypothetical protein
MEYLRKETYRLGETMPKRRGKRKT